jgi:sugar lactone lactonase YvrE
MRQIVNPISRIRRLAVFGRVGLLLFYIQFASSLSSAQPSISTYAGSNLPATAGTPAITQNIDSPGSVISDGTGGFYFTVALQQSVYRVGADGKLMLTAGNGTAGFSGDGGAATSASLKSPAGIALDAAGNLFIADSENNRIRKVTPDGVISTVAGNGTSGFSGDGGAATSASLSNPQGVTFDSAGNLFIADSDNNRIRKMTPAGVISTVAGNGTSGFGGDGGAATSAMLSNPNGVAVDAAGNLFIADTGNFLVRKVASGGVISTVAGDGYDYYYYYYGCFATPTNLCNPSGVAVDASGNLFIADSGGNRIRKMTPDGVISTVAGTGNPGFSGDGGLAASALLNYPTGVGVDAAGNLFIADANNFRVRKVAPAGTISTVAGNGGSQFAGDNGLATSARLFNPNDVAMDAAGNLFIADSGNNRIRKVTPDGVISTVAGNGTSGFSGDSGFAISAELNDPNRVAVDASGNLFIADTGNNRIRKVTPNGVISTVAGNGMRGFTGDGLMAISARLNGPNGVAVDAAGNLFIADTFNYLIRKVTPGGIISTVAGRGGNGFSGDGGSATSALLNYPTGVGVDAAGNLFIADSGNNRIRKVTPAGIISTVAGNGSYGYGGDGGLAISASLRGPSELTVDAGGNLFIADTGNNRIRKVTASGIITTVAGSATGGFGGDGGAATAALLSSPGGVAVDSSGILFIADTGNQRIRKVAVVYTVPTLTSIGLTYVSTGATVSAALTGSSFRNPFTIDAGPGITVSDILVIDAFNAKATLTIASNADLGARNLTVTTDLGTSGAIAFTVVPPFPDIAVDSSHSGSFGVGFNGLFTVGVRNVGSAPTTGALTLKDNLPTGLTYISGVGTGWSCSALGQAVTCSNPEPLNAGASTSVALAVSVGTNAAPTVTHAPSLEADGDLISSNDSASDVTTVVALPSPHFQFNPNAVVAGKQATVGITLPTAFPFDVSGVATLTFVPDAVNPVDDPAIQFATGGREVAFTIPANSVQSQFASSKIGPIGFQAGTVAGTLTFNATLQVGDIPTTFTSSLAVPSQIPAIQKIQTTNQNGFAAVMTLLSSTREVKDLILRFNTTKEVRLSCGTVAGCSSSGSVLTFDVRSLFDTWYAGDTTFGSLTALRIPLTIPASVHGSVSISLRNSRGESPSTSFPLP